MQREIAQVVPHDEDIEGVKLNLVVVLPGVQRVEIGAEDKNFSTILRVRNKRQSIYSGHLCSDQNNSNAPVAGRNSFTEGQAKSRIEAAGYSNVSDLQKDNNGVWRGKADKAGAKTHVSIDFQGNVNQPNEQEHPI